MSYLYSFRSFRRLLGVGLLAATCFRASAQTAPDTTRLSYGEEIVATPETDVPLRVQPEDRSLWKLGLNNLTVGNSLLGSDKYYTRYGLHIAYERRLKTPAWTVLAEVSPAITHYRAEPSADLVRGLGVRTQVAGRYYYNIERRLRLGKNISNFSANYVSVALGAGTGLGRPARDTPYYFLTNNERRVAADVAVVYGLQRRLGRYGFIDANIGVSSFLSTPKPKLAISNSLRIGLAIGSQSAANYSPRVVPVDEDESLQPKAYAGFLLGAYLYRVRYSATNPYRGAISPPKAGVGTYNQEILMPYAYAGYYVRPHLAVQVGMQRQREEFRGSATDFSGLSRDSITNKNDLALPVMLRYSLTRSFLKRWQFDVVGGVVPHWSSVRFQEQEFINEQLTNEVGFRRSAFGMHASAGLQASYGFGRRRHLQATTEWVLTKDLRSNFQSGESLQWGFSFIGLRYRFGYQ
ncbi:hypothetical protein SAMN00120144_2677 [Hymenobacter roseosalivarius DSM 11622]|uniref:Outer membrane protein beta-barrel domain-containing protein n=1 Tax=Hymenobacter roseosalivarius DSM 11622 TaxID=645990 RepID=A0A1W1VJY2_9BACT|nr:hypothetical protein [Hymenobacter roseosalivarius]SMB93672.1 hypothetical protein SAMN00120144_2677 [Hymenobacter roseosalivarius DSM 11622]